MRVNTNKFEALNLNFDALFYERCEKYIALLQQWGRVHNFTAELQTYQIEDNMVDSLYPLKFLETFNSFADIGTGAGYPGMILALARPDTKAVLIEPRNKRVAFLNFVKSALKLENLQVIGKRVEEVQNEEPFDLITSRAVTNTSLLLELTQNIAHEKTHYLFYKGSLLNDELEKAKIHAYTIVNVDERNYLYIKNKGVV